MTSTPPPRFSPPPPVAAWRHRDARDGFEVVFVDSIAAGYRLHGHTAAVEDGAAWAVRYEISVDPDWRTRTARAFGQSAAGEYEMTAETTGPDRWLINGSEMPALVGCLDVDFESSSLTNAFPVRRLRLAVGESAAAPAVYVRAADLSVDRLEQRYVRLADQNGNERYHYSAPAFEFECELVYDQYGLVTEYPGLAIRVR